MYRKKYTTPQTEYKGVNVITFIMTPTKTEGGIIGEGENQEGYMGCACDGDESKCTCGDCDCWGCGDS